MAAIMMPKAKAETPVGGGKTVFPEGSFVGTIEEVRTRAFPDWINPSTNPRGGYASTDGETLSIQLGGNVNLDEGGASAGNQKMFIDFVIRDGDVTVEAGPEIPEVSWQMQKSAALLTNLALALGATEEIEDEAGNVFITTTEDFLSSLQSGALTGSRVGFTTYHRPWTSKAGKTGTEVNTSEFFAAE